VLHSRYFLIEPRKGTSTELSQSLDDDELELCCVPQVMSHEFGDELGWSTADMCLLVKLAYLAQALDIFQDESKRAQIFGSADISEAVFDRWWSIKPVEYLGKTIEFRQELRSFLKKLPPSDSLFVTQWLHEAVTK
jgi:hypothetical protein